MLLGMDLGRYRLRSPSVKMVDILFEEEIYNEMRASIIDDVIKDAKKDNKDLVKLLRCYREKG
jgi:DNA-binding PucR family transcriptional regulator